MKCYNVDNECDWEGTIDTLEKHVATCKFSLLPCPNQCTDGNDEVKRFMRKDLHHHTKNDCPNRNYTCKRCKEIDSYVNITQIHDSVCKKKTLPCLNTKCTKTIQRQNMKRHFENCPYTDIACKYMRLGCDVKMERKDMTAHEQDDKLHLHVALDDAVKSKLAIAKLENTVAELKRNIAPVLQMSGMRFTLTDYQKKKDYNERVCSPTYYSYGYHMGIVVFPNGVAEGAKNNVSVYVSIYGGKYDTELKWPFVGKIKVTVLNHLEDDNHYCQTIETTDFNAWIEGGKGYPSFIPHSMLEHDPVKNTQYLKDDSLYFRMSVEVVDHKPQWLK